MNVIFFVWVLISAYKDLTLMYVTELFLDP